MTSTLVACGARTDLVAPDETDGGGIEAEAGDGPDGRDHEGGFLACRSADGIRFCGGTPATCPWLPSPECPGYGCVPAHDRDDLQTAAAGGVCWADSTDKGNTPCWDCADGDVCIQRDADHLVCTSFEVCQALWELGVRNVCRYADKRPFDGRALPGQSGACPGPRGICGAGCYDCGFNAPCTGRSPDHPYGVCAGVGPGGPCVLRVDGSYEVGCYDKYACAVFDVPSADEAVARAYGVCMTPDDCVSAAAHLPGGLRCYDHSGHQTAP